MTFKDDDDDDDCSEEENFIKWKFFAMELIWLLLPHCVCKSVQVCVSVCASVCLVIVIGIVIVIVVNFCRVVKCLVRTNDTLPECGPHSTKDYRNLNLQLKQYYETIQQIKNQPQIIPNSNCAA